MSQELLDEIVGQEVGFINESGLSDDVVRDILEREYAEFKEVAGWVQSSASRWNGGSNRAKNSTIFNQDRYTLPDGIFEKMSVAADAAKHDDVVSNAVETSEQIAFKRISVECDDEEISNFVQQIMDDMKLVTQMRAVWRELFILSQCYVAVDWGRKTYRFKGKRKSGRRGKKSMELLVPKNISILDPCKVVPMGTGLFDEDKLIYIANNDGESADIQSRLAGSNTSDKVVSSLFVSDYKPSDREVELVGEVIGQRWTADLRSRLFLLNPDSVFRIHSTKPEYQRFADIRMASVFELLDLKHNLRQSDRSDIMSNLNCIVLVKKGTDDKPAKSNEIAATGEQMRSNHRNQIIVTDHRIEVEIITKKTDTSLKAERWNAIDSRITSRLYQLPSTGAYNSGTGMDDSAKLFKVMAASMEARRDLIRDRFMEEIFDVFIEKNDLDVDNLKMTFHPRRIALDFDHNFTQKLFDLWLEGGLSLDTMLDELDLDLEQEAYRIEHEQDTYGDLFTPREMSLGTKQEVEGRNLGGNNNLGGMNGKSFTSTPKDEPTDLKTIGKEASGGKQ